MSVKNTLACAALVLLPCAALFVVNAGPKRPTGIGGGPAPLTAEQAGASETAAGLERAAREAKGKGDYAGAEADYLGETQVPHFTAPTWTWVNLGLMLDRQGKQSQAFAAYQRGFGTTANRAGGSNDPEQAEALARFGVMCEERGLHADACECYYASRTVANVGDIRLLGDTLDPDKTSSSLVQSLLDAALGVTLEQEGKPQPNPEAMDAFRASVRLAPSDPRPWYFLAYSLRRAGRFGEAEIALRKASKLDKSGSLKAEVERSLREVQERSRGW